MLQLVQTMNDSSYVMVERDSGVQCSSAFYMNSAPLHESVHVEKTRKADVVL